MKKAAILVLIMFALIFILANFLLADSRDDYQAIKKAVKENPDYRAGKEVKWFKVLVTDNKLKKDRVRITLPICLIELFLKCADVDRLKIKGEKCDIDLKKLFYELKKTGPMAIIEVYENGETVKVWLE